MNILICDPIADQAMEHLQAAEIKVDSLTLLANSTLADVISNYHGIIVGPDTVLDKSLLAKAKMLRVIGITGKETNAIDLEAATEQGIVVVNTSTGVSTSVAEYTLFLLLCISRKFKTQSMAGLGGDLLGTELRGKTLGIIGLGNVGIQVAKRAKAFDMRVVCYDPSLSRARAMMYDVEALDLVNLLIVSDFITLHAPLNDSTREMIHGEHLSLLKQGASIINTANPELINQNHLLAAVQSGQVAHVAMDLPIGYDHLNQAYGQLPQVLIGQNQSTTTVEAQLGIAEEIVQEIIRVWETGISHNAINIPLVKDSLINTFKPFHALAKTLGQFLGQMVTGNVKKIAIEYQGDLANYDITPLTQTLLQYFFSYQSEEQVINYVNAAHYAKMKKIMVETSKSVDCDDFQNYMRINVLTGTKTKTIAGHVFNSGEIKIVQIDGFALDAKPDEHFIMVPHKNKPGKIGLAGTVLGQHHINISSMAVGRTAKQDVAIMVMSVDQPLTPAVIADLESDKDIFDVRYIWLDNSCSIR